MDRDLFLSTYPRLFHMASAGSWPAIQARGLLPARHLTTEAGGDGYLLAARRERSVLLQDPVHGPVVLRDQAPLRLPFLKACLTDMTVREWLDVLNDRVFLWPLAEKLDGLLMARRYRGSAHDVLSIDTASLLAAHEERVRLSPINSGATLYPNASTRGSHTFSTVDEYDYVAHRRKGAERALSEVAVIGGVPDIRDHVLRVERRQGQQLLEVLHERPTA